VHSDIMPRARMLLAPDPATMPAVQWPWVCTVLAPRMMTRPAKSGCVSSKPSVISARTPLPFSPAIVST
jgi:hypothetical protein